MDKPIAPENAVAIVPATLMQWIVNYLQTKPWAEVDQALQALKDIPIVDKRSVENADHEPVPGS